MAPFPAILFLALTCWFKHAFALDCTMSFDDNDDKTWCIMVGEKELAYDKAETECQNQNGLLLILDDDEFQSNVLSSLKSKGIHGPYWIGLSDRFQEGIWRYSDMRRLGSSFTSWAPNEPNSFRGLDEDCVELMDNGYWNDRSCIRELKSLCQIIERKSTCNLKNLLLPNAFFDNCHKSTELNNGRTVNFFCHQGYGTKNNIYTCNDGLWEGSGKCLPVCNPPDVLENMYLISPKDLYFIEEEAQFSCIDGFFLQDNQPKLINSLKCLGINQWSSSHLQCVSSKNFILSNPEELHELLNVDFSEGDSVSLNCSNKIDQTEESINHRFNWKKNGEPIDEVFTSLGNFKISNTGQLHLFNIKEADTGIYTCFQQKVTTNEFVDVIVYRLTMIQPECEEKITMNNIQLRESESTILYCHGFRKFETSFLWLKDDEEIAYDENNHLILPDAGLLLKSINHDDAGNYTCRVTERSSSCDSYYSYTVTIKPTVNSLCGKLFNNPIDSHPWFISFWWDDEKKPFCYGVLISDQWIASAASCLANIRRRMYQHIYVKIGLNGTIIFDENFHYYSIESIIVHPLYSKRLLVNDIALVQLVKPLPLQKDIGILCLMTKVLESTLTFRRTCDLPKSIFGNISGLGPFESRSHEPNSESMIVSPNEKCRHFLDAPSTESMFCAELSNEENSSFAGDTGSPFTVEIDGRFYLHGIYSWGERILRVGKFDYFTKISEFYDWIMSHTQ